MPCIGGFQGSSPVPAGPAVVSFVMDDAGNSLIRVNGVTVDSSVNMQPADMPSTYLGAIKGDNPVPADCDVYNMALYKGRLSDANLQTLENSWMTKLGISH
jgi:hypothetical protein